MSTMSKSSASDRREEIRRQYEAEERKMRAAKEQRDRLRIARFTERHA
jgi:hypothetical protein